MSENLYDVPTYELKLQMSMKENVQRELMVMYKNRKCIQSPYMLYWIQNDNQHIHSQRYILSLDGRGFLVRREIMYRQSIRKYVETISMYLSRICENKDVCQKIGKMCRI